MTSELGLEGLVGVCQTEYKGINVSAWAQGQRGGKEPGLFGEHGIRSMVIKSMVGWGNGYS